VAGRVPVSRVPMTKKVTLMIANSFLKAFGLAAVLAVGFMQPTAAMPLRAPTASTETHAECLQRCLDEWQSNIIACKKTATICTLTFLGICIASHTDEGILATCTNAANTVHDACKAECPPAP